MHEDVVYSAVAAGCDDNIAPLFQNTLQAVVFDRHIVDLYVGKLQRTDDGAFIMAFRPGHGITHEKRPHKPISALLPWVFRGEASAEFFHDRGAIGRIGLTKISRSQQRKTLDFPQNC
jgi:hypothetical protein